MQIRNAVILAAALALGSCKPAERLVEVDRIVYKTEYKNTEKRDSIYLQDSIYIHERGDTVFVSKWKTAFRYKTLTDTVRISDSVYMEVPYLVEVPKVEYRQTIIQQILSKTGGIALLLLALAGIWKLIKMKLKL